jgi:hypothetical protein
VIGFILILLRAPNLVSNYVAHGFAGLICVYLISRYIIKENNFLSENKICFSTASYVSAGLFPALMAMFGVLETFNTGKISGLEYTSFVVIGGEFGEYRRIISKKN